MKNLLLFITLCLIFSCSSKDKSLTKLNINGKPVSQINLKKIKKDKYPLNFSELLEEVQFIRIESRADIPIKKDGWWLVGKHFIIYHPKGTGNILQFNRKGKYIRELIKYGKGPKEVSENFKMLFDKEEKHLIIADYSKPNHLLKINLENGEMMENIPLYKPCRVISFKYYKNNSLIIIPDFLKPSENNFDIFCQDLNGKLIGGVKSSIPPISAITSANMLSVFNEDISYRPIGSDTIYKYEIDNLYPNYIINDGDQDSLIQRKKPIGNIDFFKIYEAPGYFIFYVSEYLGNKAGLKKGAKPGDFPGIETLIYDKTSGKSRFIRPFYNDYTGEEMFPYLMLMKFGFKSDGTYVEAFDAFSFMELAESIKQDSSIQIKNRETILSIGESLNENDNPVLMIGKLKENVEVTP